MKKDIQIQELEDNLAAFRPVYITLLSFWMLNDNAIVAADPDEHVISHGIWRVISVEAKKGWRYYTFDCIMPMHKSLIIGEKRTMNEQVIMAMCHPVTITHLPVPVDYKEIKIRYKS